MSQSAIEIAELTKDYASGFWRKRPKRVLHGLSLMVVPGEVFGLLGPNGAGKSTTLKILLRLIFPTSGNALILGRPLGDISNHARVGFLPENPYFYDHLTASELLDYAGVLFGLSESDRHRRADELLQRVGLAESRNVPLRKFSKGMVQRVGIAQALINNPELVILDEPMSGLDPLGRREVRDLILSLREEGKTVLFSTHILSDAESICDRVAILDRGRLQGCGDLREILRMETASIEIVVENPSTEVLEVVNEYARSQIRTGDRTRIEVGDEANMPVVLDLLLRFKTKIISVNPVKMSLEDYFLSQISESDGKVIPHEHFRALKGAKKPK
jgi:ABC-2 type transport system ATP-binding protein